MFKKSSRIFAVVMALGFTGVLALAAPINQPAMQPVDHAKITVGDFAMQLTQALGYPEPSAEAAADNLRMAGVHIDPDLRAPMTQGRAAEMMRELGTPAVVSGDPAAPLTGAKASLAASTVALNAATAPSTENFDLPTACRQVGDRNSCNACCLAILTPILHSPSKAAALCSQLCSQLFPPPSSSSPGH